MVLGCVLCPTPIFNTDIHISNSEGWCGNALLERQGRRELPAELPQTSEVVGGCDQDSSNYSRIPATALSSTHQQVAIVGKNPTETTFSLKTSAFLFITHAYSMASSQHATSMHQTWSSCGHVIERNRAECHSGNVVHGFSEAG